ncbi:MAG: metallophosphoesterase family protein [Rhodocyclaceae bacterium]
MSTKVGLLSDPHATPQPVAEALVIFCREHVDRVLCAGDIAGYGNALAETVELLQNAGSACVLGNHDLWYLAHHRGEDPRVDVFLEALPSSLEFMIEGCSVYLVHAHPPDANRGGIKLRNKQGEFDVAALADWAAQLAGFGRQLLVVGHTHQVYAERMGRTLLINPGSCTFNHSCAIITLPEQRVEWFPLGGKPISLTWNWGTNELRDD